MPSETHRPLSSTGTGMSFAPAAVSVHRASTNPGSSTQTSSPGSRIIRLQKSSAPDVPEVTATLPGAQTRPRTDPRKLAISLRNAGCPSGGRSRQSEFLGFCQACRSSLAHSLNGKLETSGAPGLNSDFQLVSYSNASSDRQRSETGPISIAVEAASGAGAGFTCACLTDATVTPPRGVDSR